MRRKDTFFPIPKDRTKRFADGMSMQGYKSYPSSSILDKVLDEVEVAHDDDVRAG